MIKIAESDIAARKIFSEQRGRIRTGVLTGDSHETLHRNTDLRARQCAGHIVKAVFVVTPSADLGIDRGHYRNCARGSCATGGFSAKDRGLLSPRRKLAQCC